MNSCTADTHCDIIVVTVNDCMECQGTEKGTFWLYITEGKADCSLNDIWYVFGVISSKIRLDKSHCTIVQNNNFFFKLTNVTVNESAIWDSSNVHFTLCLTGCVKGKWVKQHWALYLPNTEETAH